MASPQVKKALTAAANGPPDSKPKAYQDLFQEILAFPKSEEQQTSNLTALSDAILAGLNIVATRPVLTAYIQNISRCKPAVVVAVGNHLLNNLQSQAATFEEQDALLREILCKAYEQEEEFSLAAKTLQGTRLDSSQRQISDKAKVQMLIRIVRLYLEDDDTVAAEQALNRVKNLSASTQTLAENPDLKLHYQLSQARILDARRKFLDASAEFYLVSLSGTVEEDDRLQALSAAIKTGVLAPAGPQRNKMLGKIYKDDRASERAEYGILEKMFLDRLLTPKEVETFASSLMPHQLAQTADGSTVWAKAVIEHNLLAVSRLYENIPTMALARILGLQDKNGDLAGDKAGDYAARMMEQGRLKGRIDQIEEVIFFEVDQDVNAESMAGKLRMWDRAVEGLVEDVERCAAGVTETFPSALETSIFYPMMLQTEPRTISQSLRAPQKQPHKTAETLRAMESIVRLTRFVLNAAESLQDILHEHQLSVSFIRCDHWL